MHNLWEEMLPFYIAGSLPKAEATRLERHLEHCETCSQSMSDWKLVAAAVRAEAASQMRALPPLSADVLREASRRRCCVGAGSQPDAARRRSGKPGCASSG